MCFLFHWEVFPWIQWGTRSKMRQYGLLTVNESSGWWEEKKPCGLSLKEAVDLLHDVNPKDIMQQWVEPSAPSLQWQWWEVYTEHVQFMFTKYFSWTETPEHPHIYIYITIIYSIWIIAWCYHVTGVSQYTQQSLPLPHISFFAFEFWPAFTRKTSVLWQSWD